MSNGGAAAAVQGSSAGRQWSGHAPESAAGRFAGLFPLPGAADAADAAGPAVLRGRLDGRWRKYLVMADMPEPLGL